MRNLGEIYYGGQKMVWGKGVEAKGLVFLSGTEGIDPSTGKAPPDIAIQTKIALDKVKNRLEEAGTDFNHIVKYVAYIVGRENLQRYRDARSSWLKENSEHAGAQYPASTLLLVSGLAQPEMLVEIDITAALPE